MVAIPMKLSPWLTPNFAVIDQKPGKREDGFKTPTSIPVEELPQEALDEMVTQWISDLYQKAGKPSPWTNEPHPTRGRVRMYCKKCGAHEEYPIWHSHYPKSFDLWKHEEPAPLAVRYYWACPRCGRKHNRDGSLYEPDT